MYPTLAEVLDLPVLRAAAPRVRAGSGSLGTRVRWVHVSELRDPTGTLSGGELVLSTGIALADPVTDPAAYVARLRDVGAAGLAVELGQHVAELPDGLVQAARARDLPLVELRRTVRFVEVTQVVHARILDEQAGRMRFTSRVHDSFRTLAAEGGSSARVLEEASSLSGQPVVLEDLEHRALAAAAGDVGHPVLLEDWPARSRQVPVAPSTSTAAGPEGWTTTPVGPRGRAWGRLVVPRRVVGAEAQEDLRMVLEQAAHALTVGRLLAGDEGGDAAGGPAGGRLPPELEAQDELLRDVLRGSRLDERSLRARARALGLPRDGVLGALVVGAAAGTEPVAPASAAAAARSAGVPALVGRLPAGRTALVLSCADPGAAAATAERAAALLPRRPGVVVGAAEPVTTLGDLREAIPEASSVVDVAAAEDAPPDPGSPGRVLRTADLGVHGLLWQLRRDRRTAAFVEAQLGPLLALGEPARGTLLRTLLAYLDAGGGMTACATAIGTSRQAAYGRLDRLRTLLGSRLADPRGRLALHLALLALGAGARSGGR